MGGEPWATKLGWQSCPLAPCLSFDAWVTDMVAATLHREASRVLAEPLSPGRAGGGGEPGCSLRTFPTGGFAGTSSSWGTQPQRWARPCFRRPHCCTAPPAPPSPSQTPLPGAGPAPELGKPFAGTTWLSSSALAPAAPSHLPGQAAHGLSQCQYCRLANALQRGSRKAGAGSPQGGHARGTGSRTRELLPADAGTRYSREGGTWGGVRGG